MLRTAMLIAKVMDSPAQNAQLAECCTETAHSRDTAPDGMGGARQYKTEQRGTCSPLVIHTQVYALRHTTGKGLRALWQLMIPTSIEPYHLVAVYCERAKEIARQHERQALAHFHKFGSRKRIWTQVPWSVPIC
jgi:hypothetical protein